MNMGMFSFELPSFMKLGMFLFLATHMGMSNFEPLDFLKLRMYSFEPASVLPVVNLYC